MESYVHDIDRIRRRMQNSTICGRIIDMLEILEKVPGNEALAQDIADIKNKIYIIDGKQRQKQQHKKEVDAEEEVDAPGESKQASVDEKEGTNAFKGLSGDCGLDDEYEYITEDCQI